MGLTNSGNAIARRPIHRTASGWPQVVPPADLGVPPRQEVEFADGSRIWLLRVDKQGVPDLFVRELGKPAGGVVVDLRRLAPELGLHLAGAGHREVPCMVHTSLRSHFASVDQLVAVAVSCGRAR
jgi:hypothetical protein